MTLVLAGCDDDFTRPPMITPPVLDIKPTSTITEVKADYWQYVAGTPQQIGLTATGDSLIIKGRVCSSDETGNIYKNIIIQSETDNGEQIALTFAVNNNKLYSTYKFGQEVFVNLTGLTVGGYSGLMQFGAVGSSGMTFMESDVFDAHVKASGMPKISAVDTTATTIAELAQAKADALVLWQSRLVRVENVQFTEPGEVFAGSANTNRYITDAEGNRLIVRNSAYASFKNERIPAGVGSVTGILSYFGSDWQILLIDEEGCQGFDGVPVEPEPTPSEAVASFVEKFDSDKIPAGWTSYKVKGDKAWYFTSFDNNYYAAMTGYKGTAPFDSWLVSPGLDMAAMTDKVLSFQSQVNGYGSKTTTLKVFALTDADPDKATKTELTGFKLAEAPSSGYSGFVASGEIDLSKFSGVIYIGFQYAATQDANYATWCIDDVYAGVKAPEQPEQPGDNDGDQNGDGDQTGDESEIFASLTGAGESMPEGWTIENKALGTMEAIWKWEVYKESGYLKATSFGCTETTLAYAISPEIDLSGVTESQLSFDHAAKFQTTLKKLCGVVVRVKENDAWSAWSDLTVPEWPAAGAWTFVNSGAISLADFDGKLIQIAFKYSGDKDGADTWEVNNLKVTGKK